MASVSSMKYLARSFGENKMGNGEAADIRKQTRLEIATARFGMQT